MRSDKVAPFVNFPHADRKNNLVFLSRNPFPHDLAADAIIFFEGKSGKLVEPHLKCRQRIVLNYFLFREHTEKIEKRKEKKFSLGGLIDQLKNHPADIVILLLKSLPGKCRSAQSFETFFQTRKRGALKLFDIHCITALKFGLSRIRTCDRPLRRRVLYPLSYQSIALGHFSYEQQKVQGESPHRDRSPPD